MCDAVATGREHAPPKCFFPQTKDLQPSDEDLRHNLVTVPSCDEHNTSRSKDDEYAMAVTVMHFDTNKYARTQFATKVIRALKRSPRFTDLVFDQPQQLRLDGEQTLSIDVDLERYYRVMDCTIRALVYHDQNRKEQGRLLIWTTEFRYSDFTRDADDATVAFNVRQLLKGTPKRGQNPDAFYYQLRDEPGRGMAIRLMFYGGFPVYAIGAETNVEGAA
jgi:hypothetical protein